MLPWERACLERQLDSNLGTPPRRTRDLNRPAEPFDDVLGDRQSEAGPAPLRREIRVEDVSQVRRRDADAGIRDDDAGAPPGAAGAQRHGPFRSMAAGCMSRG